METAAPATTQRRLATLRSFYKCYTALGYIAEVPLKFHRPLRIKSRYAEKYLEPESITLMIENEPNLRNQLIIKTLYVCGLRVSELCSLCWGNLSVSKTTGQGTIYVCGKGGVERGIAITDELTELRSSFD